MAVVVGGVLAFLAVRALSDDDMSDYDDPARWEDEDG